MTPSTADVRLRLSFFPSAYSTAPNQRLVSIEALRARLTAHPVRAGVRDKLALPAFSPATYASGATRSNDLVLALTCLVFDLDEPGANPCAAPWDDHLQFVYSTWSHTEAAPRLRRVIPLARPVPAHAWPHAWKRAVRFEPGADSSCKDLSRLYLLPARPHADAPVVAQVCHGPVFDLLPHIPPEPSQPSRPAPRVRPALSVPARIFRRVVSARFATDPASRERAATALGARIVGSGQSRRAERVACPDCGRSSAWFWLAPERQTRAHCQHRNGCGWSGPLVDLLEGRAA